MRVVACLAAVVVALPGVARAQRGEPVTYTVTRAGAEIGQEVARLKTGRIRDIDGSSLTVESHYPGSARDSALEAMLQRDQHQQLVLFQLDVHDDAGGSTILAAGSGARVLLRTDTPGSRAVREVPAGENVVLLDDHVLSLFQAVADLATPSGTRITGIYPRTGRRVEFLARQGDSDAARRIVLSGQLIGTLDLNAAGRVIRIDLPSAGLVASAR